MANPRIGDSFLPKGHDDHTRYRHKSDGEHVSVANKATEWLFSTFEITGSQLDRVFAC